MSVGGDRQDSRERLTEFLSYSHADQDRVRLRVQALEQAGNQAGGTSHRRQQC